MPVKKFRNVEDLNKPVWRPPGDPALTLAIAAVLAFGRKTRPSQFRPGVRWFQSIAEMKGGKQVAHARRESTDES
jgi:hypothetical protein